MPENLEELVGNASDKTDDAMLKGKFSLTDYLNKRSYPTAQVVVYLDVANINKLGKANDKMIELARNKKQDQAEYEKYEKYAEKFKEAVLESSLRLHLQGIDSGVVEAIREKTDKACEAEGIEDTGEIQRRFESALIAANIVKMEDSQGNEDQREFTAEDVDALRAKLPDNQFMSINVKVAELTFDSTYFDSAVDAGFLPMS